MASPGTGTTPTPAASPTASPTPLSGPAATPGIVALATQRGATISKYLLGANMAGWVDVTQSGLAAPLGAIFTATRWPGGSTSDDYHWQNNATCNGAYVNPNSTFDNFITDVARPAHLDVAVTVDYGTNAACNAGGDPTEAAAWVAYAKQKGYAVSHWTVGNENYGNWEADLHALKNDPSTYAASVAGTNGFYAKMKAADATAQVGVVVVGPGYNNWDATVLGSAPYDFVELHFYAQAPGSESDTGLLQSGASNLTTLVKAVQSELAGAGHPNTPIYVGELGSVYTNPGKQAQSIVQALFAGQILGELADDGVVRATWWIGYGGCADSSSGNFSSSLYGWQNFGGYMIVSDGVPEYGCSSSSGPPFGTPLATARAFQTMAQFLHDGEHVLGATVSAAYPNVRAYAATSGTGYALALFNLDENNAAVVTVGADALSHGSGATAITYGKAQYDQTQTGSWVGPVSQGYGAWNGSLPLTLPPWSMTVVTLAP